MVQNELNYVSNIRQNAPSRAILETYFFRGMPPDPSSLGLHKILSLATPLFKRSIVFLFFTKRYSSIFLNLSQKLRTLN